MVNKTEALLRPLEVSVWILDGATGVPSVLATTELGLLDYKVPHPVAFFLGCRDIAFLLHGLLCN